MKTVKALQLQEENLNERSRRNLAILETIRRVGPVSKADISRMSGLNIVTISNYIDHYLRAKLVNIKALDVSAGGRRPALLEINGRVNLAIGIGLNLLDMVGVVVDLNGNIVARVVKESPYRNATDILDYASGMINELRDQLPSDDRKKLAGIGVGIAGIVDNQSGTIRWPQKRPTGGCEYVTIYAPIKENLESRFGLPCCLENDATVSCFGEQWMNSDPEIRDLIYMFSGVGSGLILNGEVYRGASGCAGELALRDCPAGEYLDLNPKDIHFLEAWEDDLGIVRQTREILRRPENRSHKLLLRAGGNLTSITLRHVFEAARDGDPIAVNVVRRAGLKIGLKVAFLVNFLNPQAVVIGGGMEEGGNVFLNAVKESVANHAYAEMAQAVKIVPSRLGNNAVAVGAASLVVRQILAQA